MYTSLTLPGPSFVLVLYFSQIINRRGDLKNSLGFFVGDWVFFNIKIKLIENSNNLKKDMIIRWVEYIYLALFAFSFQIESFPPSSKQLKVGIFDSSFDLTSLLNNWQYLKLTFHVWLSEFFALWFCVQLLDLVQPRHEKLIV